MNALLKIWITQRKDLSTDQEVCCFRSYLTLVKIFYKIANNLSSYIYVYIYDIRWLISYLRIYVLVFKTTAHRSWVHVHRRTILYSLCMYSSVIMMNYPALLSVLMLLCECCRKITFRLYIRLENRTKKYLKIFLLRLFKFIHQANTKKYQVDIYIYNYYIVDY